MVTIFSFDHMTDENRELNELIGAYNVKLSSEEQMRRNQRARLNEMARFVCRG